MAYISQEDKKKVVAEITKVLQNGWKAGYRVVDNHLTLKMTIKSAPIDLVQIAIDSMNANKSEKDIAVYGEDFIHKNKGHLSINTFCLESYFQGELLEAFRKINVALNTGNHNNSDSQTDYCDVGFYTELNIGSWDKPFVVK